MVLRPATPGFAVTLAATICLAVVSFSTPLLKSIYFLSATINHSGLQGTATFGVLGYCLQSGGTTACSNTTVGWEFDPNALLSLNLPLNLEIPQVVVKWLTYVLVLHIVGLGLAAGASVFGLLAHIREMAMTCFSSCLSGVAASVTLLAFIFDIVFFIVIRTRVRAVGGVASLGNGIWLTLAAWVMLFFAGFFFGIGRCCFSSRPRGPKGYKPGGGYDNNGPNSTGGIPHSEAMRLEAIKAEEERKRRQKEIGLPAFPTGPETRPLEPKKQYYEEESEDEAQPYVPTGGGPQRRTSAGTMNTTYTTNYAGRGRGQQQATFAGGYAPGMPNARAVDQMNNPAPYRQASTNSGYEYRQNPPASSPPPMPQANQYLAAAPGQGHASYQTSYHSAVSHQSGPSSYSEYNQAYGGGNTTDPYYPPQPNTGYQQQQAQYTDPSYGQTPYHDPYGQQTQPYATTAAYSDPPLPSRTPVQPGQGYQSAYQQDYSQQQQPQTSYGNVPPNPAYPQINTSYAPPRRSPTSPTGPRPMGNTVTAVPPWEQGAVVGPTGTTSDIINNFSSTPAPNLPPKDNPVPAPGSVPSEAPPSYDLPPGAAPPGGWPREKR